MSAWSSAGFAGKVPIHPICVIRGDHRPGSFVARFDHGMSRPASELADVAQYPQATFIRLRPAIYLAGEGVTGASATRNPMSLFLLTLPILMAELKASAVLFQPPPRTTRDDVL